MSALGEIHHFYVDSDDRLSGTAGDFVYELNIPDRCDTVVLSQLALPRSFYNIAGGRSSLTTNSGVKTLTAGNYSLPAFITEFNAQTGWTATVSSITGKMTLAGTGSFTINAPSCLWRVMGANLGTTYTLPLTLPNVVNLQQAQYFYLCSDIVKTAQKGKNDSILQEIFSANITDFALITFQQTNLDMGSKSLVKGKGAYHFWLLDTDGFPIDLNNGVITFSLIAFKRNDEPALSKRFIKWSLFNQTMEED